MNDLCPHCRYSLSGLPANARCPECGVASDLPRPYLLRGAQSAAITLLAILAAIPIAAALIGIGAHHLGGENSVWPNVWMTAVAGVGVVWVFAWAFLAAQDPSVQLWRTRSAASNLIVIGSAILASITLPIAIMLRRHDQPNTLDGVDLLINSTMLLIIAQLHFGSAIVERLVKRCSDSPRRVWSATALRACALLLFAAVIPLTALSMISGLAYGRAPPLWISDLHQLLWASGDPRKFIGAIVGMAPFAVYVLAALAVGRLCHTLREVSRRCNVRGAAQLSGAADGEAAP